MADSKEWIVRFYANHDSIPEGHHDGEIVRELIRCKDCRWFYPSEKGEKGWCSFSEHGYPTADEYCSSAERKQDDA